MTPALLIPRSSASRPIVTPSRPSIEAVWTARSMMAARVFAASSFERRGMRPRLDALDQRAGSGAAGGAHRHEADLLVGALELVQQRRDQPRAARSERVAERERAAVDVHAIPVRVQLTTPRRDDRAERFV